MISPSYVRMMAIYNRAMNERLYALCATLDDATRRADRGAFFGSIAMSATIPQELLDATHTQSSVATGRSRTWPLGAFLVHLFNHQTHHRGQLTTLLSQLGRDVGVTDIPWLDVDYGF